MSNAALTWAWKQPLKASEGKATLVALADHANADGWCCPGQERLAEMTGQTERTIREHLQKLEELGYIHRMRRHRDNGSRKSDAYVLVAFVKQDVAPDVQEPQNQPEEFSGRTPEESSSRGSLPEKNVSLPEEFSPLEPQVITPRSTTPPAPPSIPKAASGGRTDNQILSQDHPEVWRRVCSIANDKNMRSEQLTVVAKTILQHVRRHGEQPVTDALDDCLLNLHNLRSPFAWVTKRIEARQAEQAARNPRQHELKWEKGTRVKCPDGRIREVLCFDGAWLEFEGELLILADDCQRITTPA